MVSSEFIIYQSSILGHDLRTSVASVISCIVLWGKLKQIILLLSFPFNFVASSNLAGLFVPVLVSFSASQTCGIPGLHFVHYSSLTLRINSVLRSPTHLTFFFFLVVVRDIFKKSSKLPVEQLHLNTLISFISVIRWVVPASIACS